MLEQARKRTLPQVWQTLPPRAVAGLVAGVCLLATTAIALNDRRLSFRQEHARAEESLLRASTNLERILERRLSTVVSLAAMVDNSYRPDRLRDVESRQQLESDFYKLTAAFDRQFGRSLSVQLAPDGIVTLLTNFERNRGAVGYDILSNKSTLSATIAAIHAQQLMLVGPQTLVQGGEAVIARQPIFLSGAFDRRAYITRGRATITTPWLKEIPRDFWGFATVLIETKTLYREAGFDELPDRYTYALRGRNGQGMQGEVFWGDASVFDRPLRTVTIARPAGQWIMGVAVDENLGWGRVLSILAIGTSFSVALGYATFSDRQSKERADAANRTKSEFLAMMRHELQTPIEGVIGLTRLARQTHHEGDRLHYLAAIQTASQLLQRVVRDVFEVSSLDSRPLEIVRVPFSLDNTLSDLRSLFALQAIQKQLEPILRIGPDVPDRLIGDALRLSQLLLDLVLHAIEHTYADRVVLEVSTIAADLPPADTTGADRVSLRFDVIDAVADMPTASMPMPHKTFEQAPDLDGLSGISTDPRLAICQRLTAAMGGQLVCNQSGPQSCVSIILHFDMSLPDSNAEVSHMSPNAGDYGSYGSALGTLLPLTELRSQWHGKRALVADSSVESGQAIALLLESFGFEATVVHSGEAAIDRLCLALETQPFDVVLLGEVMPDLSGHQVISQLDSSFVMPPFLRGLLLAPCVPTPSVARLERGGFDAYLQKPVDRRQLRYLLQAVPTPLTSFATHLPIHSADAMARMSRLSPDASRIVLSPSVSSASETLDRASEAHPAIASVLLVEDNEVNQFVAREMLHNLGYGVEIVGNGRLAIERIRRDRYDLILMDVQMPVMGGLEATQHIRELAKDDPELDWCSTVVIVAMTAHDADDRIQLCLDAGMNDWLSKPMEAQRLQDMLRRWLPDRALENLENTDRRDLRGQSDQSATRSHPDSDISNSDINTDLLPGLVIETGLARMGGDWDDYRELLSLFAKTYQSFESRLTSALELGQYDRAYELTHTLKGAAGNIGAEDLADTSLALERALQVVPPDNDRLMATRTRLLHALHQAIDGIERTLQDKTSHEEAPHA